VDIADSVLKFDDPRRRWLPALAELLEAQIGISRERSESCSDGGQLERDDRIGTAEVASILGCTQRRVQQKIKSGELTAEIIGRNYVLKRRDIA
jgi:excisionase family DNA binding protein